MLISASGCVRLLGRYASAIMQGSFADVQGSFADMRGSFVNMQGSFANMQGSFANLRDILLISTGGCVRLLWLSGAAAFD